MLLELSGKRLNDFFLIVNGFNLILGITFIEDLSLEIRFILDGDNFFSSSP